MFSRLALTGRGRGCEKIQCVVGNGRRTVPCRDHERFGNKCVVGDEERCGERSLQQSGELFHSFSAQRPQALRVVQIRASRPHNPRAVSSKPLSSFGKGEFHKTQCSSPLFAADTAEVYDFLNCYRT